MSKEPVRNAIRDAMAEEMRNDPDVFLIGEEVGEYEGAYKVSQGLIAEFGDKRRKAAIEAVIKLRTFTLATSTRYRS